MKKSKRTACPPLNKFVDQCQDSGYEINRYVACKTPISTKNKIVMHVTLNSFNFPRQGYKYTMLSQIRTQAHVICSGQNLIYQYLL
jgi:hypothetical protein